MVEEVTLEIECFMTLPKRPTGVAVLTKEGRKFIGLATLDDLRKAVAELDALESELDKRSRKG